MAGQKNELVTADGDRLGWTAPSEAYADDECDAHLAKVLQQMEGCQSTAITAARYKKAIAGSSTTAQRIKRIAQSPISDGEMKKIADGRDWLRQAALASNPHLTDAVAHSLMNSLNTFVRVQLAHNVAAPDLVLRRLVRDPDVDVQRGAEISLLRRDDSPPTGAERTDNRRKRRRR